MKKLLCLAFMLLALAATAFAQEDLDQAKRDYQRNKISRDTIQGFLSSVPCNEYVTCEAQGDNFGSTSLWKQKASCVTCSGETKTAYIRDIINCGYQILEMEPHNHMTKILLEKRNDRPTTP